MLCDHQSEILSHIYIQLQVLIFMLILFLFNWTFLNNLFCLWFFLLQFLPGPYQLHMYIPQLENISSMISNKGESYFLEKRFPRILETFKLCEKRLSPRHCFPTLCWTSKTGTFLTLHLNIKITSVFLWCTWRSLYGLSVIMLKNSLYIFDY